MSIIIDLLLLGIVVYCGWQGLKRGLLNSAFGIVALIIAVFFGHLVGVVYSDEFSGMFQPFVSGLVDGAINTVTEDYNKTNIISGDDEVKLPVVVLNNAEKTDVYSVSHAALRQLGIGDSAAKEIATEVATEQTTVDQAMALNITSRLCNRIGYVLITVVIFAIVAIIAAIIGNTLNLYFAMPNLERVNRISGSVLGAVKGIIIIMFIACFCRYFGLLLTNRTVSKTILLEFLINHNKLASILGI